MKKLFSFLMISLLALSLAACNQPETPAKEPDKGYDSFREHTEEMTLEEAETYLQKEAPDETKNQYKEAIYTVNENAAAAVIEKAQKAQKQTEEVTALFSGISFKFLEGDQFGSETVRNKLSKYGSCAAAGDGWYLFTFYDRTLAQNAITMDNDHALREYTTVLELLLSDPNVTVKTIN